jgi:hypothetical protein
VFSPSSFSGLQIWLDGSDPLGTGTAPANGTSITTWYDKSGKSNNATGSNAASYTVDAAGNYLSFNGSNTSYNIGSGSFIANQYFTIFIVERLQVNTNTTINLLSGSNTSPNTNLLVRYTGSNATGMDMSYYDGANVGGVVSAYTTATDQPTRLWSYTQKQSFTGIYLNASVVGSNNSNILLGSWNGPSIGRDSSSSPAIRYYGGHMKEILIFTGDMAVQDRQTVEGYLAWKWGLQSNLPATHPYKNNNPGAL